MSPADVAHLIEHELTAARVPGAAIAIVSGDERFAGSYGLADADARTPMTPSTLLQAGSLTKLFTALAVSTTLEAQQIQFESPVGRQLRGLAPEIARLTFHQLLAQTSGLRDRAGTGGSDDEAALAAAARALGAADAILPPGTVFSYSNPGYALVGAALEAIRRQPFADALADTTLDPLGMAGSTLRPAVARARPHAVGHRLDAATVVTLPTPVNDTRIWPSGYLWTNADDLSRALTALLHEGRLPGHQGLALSVIRRVSQPHTPMPNVFVGGHYGYGLMIARDRGTLIYEHGGTMPGFSSMVRMAPERGLGLAILTNLDNAPLRRVAQSVMATTLGLPDLVPPARTETPVTADEMKPLLGRYENRSSADLAVGDGRVVLVLDGGPAMTVTRIGEHRYLARPAPDVAGPEFVVQQAANGVPYLHLALWAYAKR
jgi:CubicO group peptidase (beta-lactamase class C family)